MIDRDKFSAQRMSWNRGARYGNVIFVQQGPCTSKQRKILHGTAKADPTFHAGTLHRQEQQGLRPLEQPESLLRWGHHGGEHGACDPPAVRCGRGHALACSCSRCVRAMRSYLRKLSSVGPASQQVRTSSKLNGSTRSILAAGGGRDSEPGGGTIFPSANEPTVPTSRSIMSSGEPLNIAIPARREGTLPASSRTPIKPHPRREENSPFFLL